MFINGAAARAVMVAALVVAGSTLTADVASADRTHASRGGVLGYIESGDGLAALRRNLPALTSVGIDGVNISASGASVPAPDRAASAMLAATHRAGKTAELLVGNFNGAIGDFDPDAAHRLFVSPRHRASVIHALVRDARRGWDGIHLDFESLRGSDRAGLTRFTSDLRAALPAAASLSMAVMANSTSRGYRAAGYDLPALAKRLTRVVLMAYDQHGPTWSAAGPVGGLHWARQALTAMLRSVPRRKVILGVAGYGYTWPAHGTGTQLSDRAARRAARSPSWAAGPAEWHGVLRNGGSIWWSDARSLRVRRQLARELRLRGVAVWSLALCDPIPR